MQMKEVWSYTVEMVHSGNVSAGKTDEWIIIITEVFSLFIKHITILFTFVYFLHESKVMKQEA